MLRPVPELAHATLALVLLVERRCRETWREERISTGREEEKPAHTFADTARELRHAVAQAKDRLLRKTPSASSNADPKILVPVHHHAVVRLNEEVGDSARDVREEADGVAEEVC